MGATVSDRGWLAVKMLVTTLTLVVATVDVVRHLKGGK